MGNESSILSAFLPLIVLVVIFYFLLIRPQQKQAKRHKEMLSSLKKGDTIVTKGGLYGDIVKPEENFIKIKLNDETVVKLDKGFIFRKVVFEDSTKQENTKGK